MRGPQWRGAARRHPLRLHDEFGAQPNGGRDDAPSVRPGSSYVDSAGARAGELDPMAVEAMEEIGIEIGKHKPRRFDDLEDTAFDLVITLSPEAQAQGGRTDADLRRRTGILADRRSDRRGGFARAAARCLSHRPRRSDAPDSGPFRGRPGRGRLKPQSLDFPAFQCILPRLKPSQRNNGKRRTVGIRGHGPANCSPNATFRVTLQKRPRNHRPTPRARCARIASAC